MKASDLVKKRPARKAGASRGLSARPDATTTNGRRYWTDDERASILAAVTSNGGDVARTARETGVPYATIYCWVQGHRCPEALQLRNEKQGNLANACEELAWLFAAMIPEKVDKAPLNHLTAGLGIMVEKMKLLRGEPTNYGRTETKSSNVSINLERLPPDERAVFLALWERLTRDHAGGGAESGGQPAPVERHHTRFKSAAVLEAGVSGGGSIDAT